MVAHGGSLSGEHGDGQARGELLQRMYGPELTAGFSEFKRLWDPEGRMNPGKVVDPRPLDADLRLGAGTAVKRPDTVFSFEEDKGFDRAVLRCVGVGRCRQMQGGTMCPSYRATRDERHSNTSGGGVAEQDRSKNLAKCPISFCFGRREPPVRRTQQP